MAEIKSICGKGAEKQDFNFCLTNMVVGGSEGVLNFSQSSGTFFFNRKQFKNNLIPADCCPESSLVEDNHLETPANHSDEENPAKISIKIKDCENQDKLLNERSEKNNEGQAERTDENEQSPADDDDKDEIPDCSDFQRGNFVEETPTESSSDGSEHVRSSTDRGTEKPESIETPQVLHQRDPENWGLDESVDGEDAEISQEKSEICQPVQEESMTMDMLANFDILQKNNNSCREENKTEEPEMDPNLPTQQEKSEANSTRNISTSSTQLVGDPNDNYNQIKENAISDMKKIMVKTLEQINSQIADNNFLISGQRKPEDSEVSQEATHVSSTSDVAASSLNNETLQATDEELKNKICEIVELDSDGSQLSNEAKAIEPENSHQSAEEIANSSTTPESKEIHEKSEISQSTDEAIETNHEIVDNNCETKSVEGAKTPSTLSEAPEDEDTKSMNSNQEGECSAQKLHTEEEPVIVVEEKIPQKPKPSAKNASIVQKPRIPPIKIKADKKAKATEAPTSPSGPETRRRQYHRRCKPSVIIDGEDSPDECVVTNNEKPVPPVTVPASITLKKKYESPLKAQTAKRARVSEEVVSPRIPSQPTVDDRTANSLIEKLQKSVGSALSITIKKKRPIPTETLNALEQLKNMSEISTTKISRSEPCSSPRPTSIRKTLPPSVKKSPAPAMGLPIITSVISSKNENGSFFNVANQGGRRLPAPTSRTGARNRPKSIPYVVLD